jgi:small-conductance mechanosensitive channel
MKTNELLAKYPLATEVIRKSYFDKMIASVESAKDIPEEFKQSLMNEAITDERLIVFIDSQPRTLFDVFDDNKIFICISVWTKTPGHFENVEFGIALNGTNKNNSNFSSRKEAELVAIAEAFELLEEKITPLEFPNIEDEAVIND